MGITIYTQQPALGPRGAYGPFYLCVIHKEGLCPSSIRKGHVPFFFSVPVVTRDSRRQTRDDI
jgi:hypothetical protein